ncbi:hypothetical protein X802_07975 [Thermococcus guaymasensis DSM 11113]|uniref:Uncharacterized protein n=1 Tax=Thermococcus guaymasensis DSM 11113 TaxID=1432656 RepID=A0A0X1KLH2_9EURY|nr:hypothetical protein [Thermococcus guaymasensis]AJC72108.1 hypothetical protein X802_07975 [Thermococcus guaymasensis DSM 11113]
MSYVPPVGGDIGVAVDTVAINQAYVLNVGVLMNAGAYLDVVAGQYLAVALVIVAYAGVFVATVAAKWILRSNMDVIQNEKLSNSNMN